MDDFVDCDIVDLNDDSSEYTFDSTTDDDEEEEENSDHEEKLKELDIDGKCRMEQTVYDLQYKLQSRTISNIDIEVYFQGLRYYIDVMHQVERIKIRVDRVLADLNKEDEEDNFDLKKKYLLSWASGRIRRPSRIMAELKNNLITEFSTTLDREKF